MTLVCNRKYLKKLLRRLDVLDFVVRYHEFWMRRYRLIGGNSESTDGRKTYTKLYLDEKIERDLALEKQDYIINVINSTTFDFIS